MTEWLVKTDLWRWQNLLGLTACVVILVILFRDILSLAALWGYSLVSSLWVFQYPTKTHTYALCFDQTTGQAFSQMVLMPLAVALLPRKYFKNWRAIFTGVAVFESVMLGFFGYGLMSAKTFDTAFIATIVPIAANPYLKGLLALTALGHGGATAALVLLTAVVVNLWRTRKYRAWIIAGGIIAAAIASKYIDSSGRVMYWQAFFKWWASESHFLFGTGIGTFEWMPRLVKEMRLDDRIFLQMHNDWLQMLFEGGAVGLALMVSAFVYVYKKAERHTQRQAVLCTAVCMLTYHPSHFFISGLFMLCLIREVVLESS